MLAGLKQHFKVTQSYLDPRQLGSLVLYVTNLCNFRCKFCFYLPEIEKGKKPDLLTVDEMKTIAEKMGPLVQLAIGGGEPFLRRELDAITRVFLDHTYARYVSIPTNASLTDKIVRYLETILPAYPNTSFRVCFSIEGIGAAHDELRSMPGSYKKIQESYAAVSPLRDRFSNFILDASSVYTARSEATLLDTVRTLSEDFRFDNIAINYLRGEVQDPELKRSSQEGYVKVLDFLDGLKRKKEKRFLCPIARGMRDVTRRIVIDHAFEDRFRIPCVAGRKFAVIYETGDVHPCEVLGKSMGNLRQFDYDIKKLMGEAENQKLARWIVDSKCKCSYECALAASVAWNPSVYPALLRSAVKNLGEP
jgi:radical SAM protein with 4Fe4S-binding SPASM domain